MQLLTLNCPNQAYAVNVTTVKGNFIGTTVYILCEDARATLDELIVQGYVDPTVVEAVVPE